VEAAAAIGRIAEKETLPEDLREREKPNDRKPLSDIAFEGNLQASRNSQLMFHVNHIHRKDSRETDQS
jgi:hypothetical protein